MNCEVAFHNQTINWPSNFSVQDINSGNGSVFVGHALSDVSVWSNIQSVDAQDECRSAFLYTYE